MDGQPVYDDVSEGDALLPTSQQNRRKRLRPAVGAAVACVAAFGAVAVVTNSRPTELRQRPEKKTPTIVISLLDDQGYADVPWHAQDAATQAAMPFADALRKDAGGIDVPNYHAWRDCTPSRRARLNFESSGSRLSRMRKWGVTSSLCSLRSAVLAPPRNDASIKPGVIVLPLQSMTAAPAAVAVPLAAARARAPPAAAASVALVVAAAHRRLAVREAAHGAARAPPFLKVPAPARK